MVKTDRDQAGNEVMTNEQGVVISVWRGHQTEETVRATGDKIVSQLTALKATGKKTVLLTDITDLRPSDTPREARIASKHLGNIKPDAAAIVGNGPIATTAMYITRLTKQKGKSRWFNNRRQAIAWLLGSAKTAKARSMVSLVVGAAVGLIGVAALVGWHTGNPYLMRFMPGLRPINPVAAVGLIVMCIGFCSYWANNFKILKITGLSGAALGLAALLPLHIDTVLYGGRMANINGPTDIADAAAVCFIAMGITAYIAGDKKRWVRPLEYALTSVIVAIGLFNIFGQLYAPEFIYGLTGSFVMSLNLAIAFVIAGGGLLLLIIYRQVGDILGLVTRSGWLIVAALLFVQFATYAAWDQAVTRNKVESLKAFDTRVEDINTSVSNRLQAYVDALYGFRGLFAASTAVSQGDFSAYYQSLQLDKDYPGLRSIVYLAAVKESDLPAFVQQHRADTTLFPGGNPTFTIQAKSNEPVHYISTYNATTPDNTAAGIDLSSTPGRSAIYGAAIASGGSYASGTVQFASTNTTPEKDGFFITIPVKTAGSNQYSGLVNVVFNYADFFPKLFMQNNLVRELNVKVVDGSSAKQIYHSAHMRGEPSLGREITIPVVNHNWQVDLTVGKNFGITSNQAQLPATLLVGGQAFSLLLVLVFIMQGRARREALNLAESITEDLEYERNRAIAKDQRSGAILTSIGDAVFAIDRHKRITLFNPAAQQISGFTEAEALGNLYKDILDFRFEKNGRTNDSFIRKALDGHVASMRNHTVLVRKDGTKVAVADSAAPIFNAKREIEGVIIVFRNISKESELDRAKTEFVSLASHQLRTPLSAVNWYSEMLLNGDAGKLTKAQTEHVREIYEGNQRMVELVNSLLDVSRLDLGKLTNQPTPTSMIELTESLHKELTASITQKQLKFDMNLAAKMPPVIADPKLLRMIVQNLLSNAVKYTPANGSVTVTMKADKINDKPSLNMTVADTGYGIPQAQQSKIFSKLFRADNVRALDAEGTGLGLYIAQQAVQKLGGSIWFDSEENKGTTFHVVLPFDTWNKNESNTTK